MKLDDVFVSSPRARHDQPERVHYKRADGYEIDATPQGVRVERRADCRHPRDRDEPDAVLIPWTLVLQPCAVSAQAQQGQQHQPQPKAR